MRTFEILLVSVLFLCAASLFRKAEKRNRWYHLLPAFSLLIILAHILVEGPRWQMLPLYLYAVSLFALTLKNGKLVSTLSEQSERKGRLHLRIVVGVCSILLLFVISMPPLLVPVFELPDPSGSYNVGIKYDYFVDRDRPEPLTPDSMDFQEISVEIRYPAEISSRQKAVRYWEDASQKSEAISKFWGGLPSFLFSHFSLINTHSYEDAHLSVKERVYPVLIFNHGSLGLPSLNTVLVEDLASHGFVVLSIGHSDYIPFFVKPDGSIKAFDPNSEALQSKMRENDDPEVRSIAQQLMKSKDVNEQERLLRRFLEKNSENQKSLFRWARDISFAIGEVERLNNGNGFFAGRLDLNRIGVFGVSFGGAASVQACVNDRRCKAAISMDCPQFGDFLDNEVTQPIMFMSSEQYKGLNDLFLQLKHNPVYIFTAMHTTHQNFSDLSIWGKMFQMQMLGEIDGRRCLQIQNRYVLAFFEKYLKNIDSGLLRGNSPEYPEVSIVSENTE